MSLNIADLLDKKELNRMMDAGRITKRYHPDLPLVILNYTSLAQYANEWTNSERVCRGLIVDSAGTVIARGMPKFFNYGDPHGPEFDLTDIGFLSRKEDGSLGIGWSYAGVTGIATRGSFNSEQAKKATSMLTADAVRQINKAADLGMTVLYEIIYPDNRIVLEYNDLEKNILLGVVRNETGEMTHTSYTHVAAVKTLIQKDIPDDEEGYVVAVAGKGMFKLKGETYLNLHKLMFGLTEKAIWEMLQSHNVADRMAYVEKFPPITRVWVERKIKYFQDKHAAYVSDTNFVRQHMHDAIPGATRKEQALWLKDMYPDAMGRVFSQLDGGNERLYREVWKKIKPAHRPYKIEKED